MEETKLIVLRGPSGSGKSSIARAIQIAQINQSKLTAYIEQDYFRRIVLKEKDVVGGFNIQLMKETVLFLLKNQHDVIMEGIFDTRRYEKMFKEIITLHLSNNFFFYMNISLDETIRRHDTKPNKDEFGEKELRDWYRENDQLSFIGEEIISVKSSAEEAVRWSMSASEV
jgi:adenylylsulfate kinase-like enzyme